jgi:Mg2+/Co2+ transporter CorB
VVSEAARMIPKRHQRMLISVLELQDVTVDDIMVPRNEIDGSTSRTTGKTCSSRSPRAAHAPARLPR